MKPDYFSKDIKDLLRLLHFHKVKYVIVGGEAVIYYGYPRLTGDVDFFYQSVNENVKRLYKALLEFWDEDIPGIQNAEEFTQKGIVVQFGAPPHRVDLLNTVDGVSFDEAWENRTVEEIRIEGGNIPVYYIGKEELINNKRALGRYKDLDDLKYLYKEKG
jgi:predicted nucleotidyltransferase